MPGSFGKPVGPKQVLMRPGALVCGAGAAPGRETWFLWWCPVPACSLCSEVKGSGQWSWQLAVVIWPGGQSTGGELLPGEGEGSGNGVHWLLHPRECLQLLGLLCVAALFCSLFRSSSSCPHLSRRSNCSLHRCLSLLMAGGEFSIHLCCCCLGPSPSFLLY